LYDNWWLTGLVYVAIVALGLVTLMADPRLQGPGWYGLFMALPVYAVAAILLVPILRNRAKGQLRQVALAIVGFVYFGWMFSHLGFLANTPFAYGYLLYLVVAVEINDVAAFTFGKIFGKHKLRENISPNKTIEGFLGAVGVSMTIPWLLSFSFPHFEPLHLILTGLIVGVGGQLGDLVISYIKRDIGIKDMGVVISGHGGILDRVDSMIFVAPIFFHMMRWFHGLV
jgi:phosphatidate cytidylyltransferase